MAKPRDTAGYYPPGTYLTKGERDALRDYFNFKKKGAVERTLREFDSVLAEADPFGAGGTVPPKPVEALRKLNRLEQDAKANIAKKNKFLDVLDDVVKDPKAVSEANLRRIQDRVETEKALGEEVGLTRPNARAKGLFGEIFDKLLGRGD